MNTKLYGIKELARTSGMSEVYIRRMIGKGVIPTTKVRLNDNQFKHMISEEDWATFRATRNHSKREDGRNRFLLYVTADELQKVQDLLNNNDLNGVEIKKQPQYHKDETE